MSTGRHTAFDPDSLARLLGSEDSALLSPLFERAVAALSAFLESDSIDPSLLEFEAHKLKTTCNQIGLHRLSNIFESLEQSAKTQDGPRSDALLRILRSEYLLVKKELERHASSLASAAKA